MPTVRSDVFDILVIGAGPAGLSAATAAARIGLTAGIRVALLDAGARPGGQYWRHRPHDTGAGHHDWDTFMGLRAALEALRLTRALTYLPHSPVWHLERTSEGFTAHVADDGNGPAGHEMHGHEVHGRELHGRQVHGRQVILATGAYDRQLPFPGWTLPGVFAAGGAQALLKGQGVVAGRRVVVAGTGPFLLPVAAGLAEAGADVAGVFEAGRPTAVLRHPATAARNAGKLREAAGYMATLARHRVPYSTGRTVIAAHADGIGAGIGSVTTAGLDAEWRIRPGTEVDIACDTLAVGYGFTPQVELAVDIGCHLALDADGSLVVTVDGAQHSSVDGAFVAGEACGVGGSALALVEGELAGLHAAAAAAGRRPGLGAQAALERQRERLQAFAALLPAAWPVKPGWRTWVTDGTIVCRCEEIPASGIRAAVTQLGATDARSAKLFARAGMGLCQGRVCGYATAALTAQALARDVAIDDLHASARRPVAWPVTLGALAAEPVAVSVPAPFTAGSTPRPSAAPEEEPA
jgi:NADPH-dependent 2,4-dienoyl-CoA reductase/sulfur reductase-like enzyme